MAKPLLLARLPILKASFELGFPMAGVVPPYDGWRRPGLAPARRWMQRLILPGLPGKPSGLPATPNWETRDFGNALAAPTRPPWLLARAWKTRSIRAAIVTLFLIITGLTLAPVAKSPLGQLESFVRDRSAIVLTDDFSSGLSGWDGGPTWARNWAYDPAGYVRPGKLALLSASIPLTDYRFEFRGEIRKKSLGWAFRASDLRNYYAMKILITKPGPVPMAVIVRYAVVDGRAVDQVQLPLFLDLRRDSIYHVETKVDHDRFITSINGRIVDNFSDRRHPSGGVGLLSAPDEDAHILWVRVAYQDDILGQICAYFSRHPADSTEGAKPVVKTEAPAITDPARRPGPLMSKAR
jgi:hypothetical protein